MINVVLLDHPDSGADSTSLGDIAAALTKQVQRDVAPIYGISATVRLVDVSSPGDWVIGLFADADQPGALGYHSDGAQPWAKVFPKLDAQDGGNLSTTISHELIEMLLDAWCIGAYQSPDGTFWAAEACDAVERDEYDIDGVKVSNFVTPAWYGATGAVLDFMRLCMAPLEVRPGGYAQKFVPGTGWQQVGAMRAYRTQMQALKLSRGVRRAAKGI